MRTITLELLRHGPPHNQLLSPLTEYLALCENHVPVTLRLPFEHNQFLHRLQALGYDSDEKSRAFQLADTARLLGDLLAQVPGLVAELNRDHATGPETTTDEGAGDAQATTHLRLVVSASELSLLPFELALAPPGLPGAGQPLLLQSQRPISLTREVRRVPDGLVEWPSQPRILLAAAAPPGVGTVPLDAHLVALRKIIEPWLSPYDDAAGRRARVEEHLTVLPQASADALQEACASRAFTHVHLLAHGVQYWEGFDVRFGLALHDARDPDRTDVVTGARLASMLRAAQGGGVLSRPMTVTLASCNSGNAGTIGGMGASLAHALHEAGIPIVVAGQFPLSFEGSVRLVEVVYEGLLWGEDPRAVLSDLRRRLHAEFPHRHDWATLTAYASLPPRFERRLLEVRIKQAVRGINIALAHADRATALGYARLSTRRSAAAAGDSARVDEALARAKGRIERAKARLEALRGCASRQRPRVYGLLASAEKRYAEVCWRCNDLPATREALRAARSAYWRCFQLDRASSWAIVQFLALDVLLRTAELGELTAPGEHARPADLWTMARILSLNELGDGRRDRKAWAYGNLLELDLLAVIDPSLAPRPPPPAPDLAARALRYAKDLVTAAGADSFSVYSTRRQLLRYLEWYPTLSAPIRASREAIEAVLGTLPESDVADWS